MFDKLVVSSKAKSGRRVPTFFVATVAAYSILSMAAIAVSVLAANPDLQGKSPDIVKIYSVQMERTERAQPAGGGGQPHPAARQDLRNPMSLVNLLANTNHPPASPINAPPGLDNKPVDWSSSPGPGDGPGQGRGPGGSGTLPGSGATDAPAPEPPTKRDKPAAAADKGPVHMTSTVLQGRAIFRKTPLYPPLAHQIHLEGSVMVEIVISAEGEVESARAVSGHPLLVSAAVSAAREWRFQPTVLGGHPVQCTGIITFNFKFGS